jgi:hypothetical protein
MEVQFIVLFSLIFCRIKRCLSLLKMNKNLNDNFLKPDLDPHESDADLQHK